MFKLEPISTNNLFTLFQIIVVMLGFYFSWRSLKATRESISVATDSLKLAGQNLELTSNNVAIATSNAQAQLFNQMVIQGRELQYRFIDVFFNGAAEEIRQKKEDAHIGMAIAYYASFFELKKIMTLPENVEKLFEADLKEFMRESRVRRKWDDVKHNHSVEFGRFVEGVRGVK